MPASIVDILGDIAQHQDAGGLDGFRGFLYTYCVSLRNFCGGKQLRAR